MSLVHWPADTGTGRPRAVQQFAALPWRVNRHGAAKALLVTSRHCGSWVTPKGWQMLGRTPVQSATHRAFKQAGVVGDAAPEPIGGYRYFRQCDDGTLEPVEVTVFRLHVRGTLVNWPQGDQRKRRWWPVSQAWEAVREPGLAGFLKSLANAGTSEPAACGHAAEQAKRAKMPEARELGPAVPMQMSGGY